MQGPCRRHPTRDRKLTPVQGDEPSQGGLPLVQGMPCIARHHQRLRPVGLQGCLQRSKPPDRPYFQAAAAAMLCVARQTACQGSCRALIAACCRAPQPCMQAHRRMSHAPCLRGTPIVTHQPTAQHPAHHTGQGIRCYRQGTHSMTRTFAQGGSTAGELGIAPLLCLWRHGRQA